MIGVAGIVLQGAKAGGFGLGEALSRDVISSVLGTRFGEVWALQAGLAIAVAILLLAGEEITRPRACGATAADAVAVGPRERLWSDRPRHGRGSRHRRSSLGRRSAALVIALLWAGAARWELAVTAVPRFSGLAVVSVSWLIASGTVSAYLQVRALRGLWETTYGQLLLVKITLVLPLLALGLYNNRRAVPRLRERLATTAERRRFLRIAATELALMVAIVSVTAVLVTEPPARAEVAPRGPYATTAQLGDLELNLVVDPATAGLNQIHLYLTNSSGQPTDVDEATVSATLASRQIGPIRMEAHPAGPGHFVVHGAQLALAGDWQLRVEVRRGEFNATAATVSVPIRKDSH